jgi:hypothetical protein
MVAAGVTTSPKGQHPPRAGTDGTGQWSGRPRDLDVDAQDFRIVATARTGSRDLPRNAQGASREQGAVSWLRRTWSAATVLTPHFV